VGFFTDDVVKALDRRKSSTTDVLLVGGGTERSGWGGKGSWLFRKCSGVSGGDDPSEDGTRVGNDGWKGEVNFLGRCHTWVQVATLMADG